MFTPRSNIKSQKHVNYVFYWTIKTVFLNFNWKFLKFAVREKTSLSVNIITLVQPLVLCKEVFLHNICLLEICIYSPSPLESFNLVRRRRQKQIPILFRYILSWCMQCIWSGFGVVPLWVLLRKYIKKNEIIKYLFVSRWFLIGWLTLNRMSTNHNMQTEWSWINSRENGFCLMEFFLFVVSRL